jgi:acetylglutamate kinase
VAWEAVNKMQNKLVLLALLLSFLAPSGAFIAPTKSSFRKTTFYRAVAGDEEYDNLLVNVKKNTPPGSVIVIKYGGHAMENEELKRFFCEDIAALCNTGILPVIVHGGGPQIASMLKKLEIESKFLQGLRVTDQKTMEVAQMVLCGAINKDISGMISAQPGVRGAIGLCGLDGKMIQAKAIEKIITDESGKQVKLDLGLVGDPTIINSQLLKDLLALALVPVIAPIGSNEIGGTSLNINADTAAGAVAEALKANRLLLLTDVTGVLDKTKTLITKIPSSNLSTLTVDGTISGGMIPKLETAVQAVEAGVGAVSIMDGRVRHCILKALSGEIFGTSIVKE